MSVQSIQNVLSVYDVIVPTVIWLILSNRFKLKSKFPCTRSHYGSNFFQFQLFKMWNIIGPEMESHTRCLELLVQFQKIYYLFTERRQIEFLSNTLKCFRGRMQMSKSCGEIVWDRKGEIHHAKYDSRRATTTLPLHLLCGCKAFTFTRKDNKFC